MIDAVSGLPIAIDETTGELSFHDGLLCDADSIKRVGQMAGLFRSIEGGDPDRLVYRAYRNIRFPEHDALFSDAGLRYDITVVLPGTVNGEFFKTSGHYHGAGPGQALPYPEVYEVVKGTIAFVLQYDPLFDTPDEGAPDDVRVMFTRSLPANNLEEARTLEALSGFADPDALKAKAADLLGQE